MRGLHIQCFERFIKRTHDMQQGPRGFSRDLEHAHQAISSRFRDNDNAGVVSQAGRNRFALGKTAQEISGYSKVGDSRKIPYTGAGVGRPPILAEGVMVFRRGLIGEFTLEPGEQDSIDRVKLEAEWHEEDNSNPFR